MFVQLNFLSKMHVYKLQQSFVKCVYVKLQIGAFHRSISSCQRQSRDVCRLVLHTLEQSGLDFSGFLGTQIADQSVLSLFRFLGIQQRKFTFSEVLKKEESRSM